MYGIVIHFDFETESFIKRLWVELSESCISKYAEEVRNRRPHITLASYNDLKTTEFIDTFEAFYSNKTKFEIKLSMIGVFINSGTLFLAPTPTLELIAFHESYHNKFNMYEKNSNPQYMPNNWIPHCTIANRLSEEKLLEAIRFCNRRIRDIVTTINEVSIIKLEYNDNKCVSTAVIATRNLL